MGGWVLVRSVQHAVDAQHSSARTTLNYEIHPIMTQTRRCVATTRTAHCCHRDGAVDGGGGPSQRGLNSDDVIIERTSA